MSELTIMTFNIANGLAEPAALVDALRRSHADVIGLQELAHAQSAAIQTELSRDYPYQRLHPLGIPGKGLLSRFPILAMDLLHLHPGRPDLRATIDVNGTPMRIIVAHPPPPKLQRTGLGPNPITRRQILGLLQIVHDGGPCVLMGDFNLPPQHPVYRMIAGSGLTDAFKASGSGQGLTLPMRMARWAYQGRKIGDITLRPVMRVDYVWLTRHFESVESWVGEHAGSDHLPVFARVRLIDPSGTVVTHFDRAPDRRPRAIRGNARR